MSLPTLTNPPETSSAPEPASSIVELIYAGHALACYLVINVEVSAVECVCGFSSSNPQEPDNHYVLCPVGRYYRAVEAVRKAALLG